MRFYLRRRLLTLLPVLLGVTFAVFVMLHLMPVDPVMMMITELSAGQAPVQRQEISDARYAAMRHEMGLDRPLLAQYGSFLARVVSGDLGRSFQSRRAVWDLIASNAGATVELAISGLGVAILLGISLGVLAALYHDTWIDAGVMAFSVAGLSLPSFWLGIMLILLVSFQLGWLPIVSSSGWQGLILPALALGVRASAVIARLVRSSVVEILNLEYIRTARAKGLGWTRIVLRHALKNALIPVVTVVGLQFGNLLSGAVIIESVFGRPGLGSMAVQAINFKDFPLVQGTVLVLAMVYVGVNLLVDLSYAWLNPEIRLGT
ncbi:MAG: ABC transporter permease [Armatimonadetes bacterium]|nr:ABC transporter permease [Armatimonadota bacterium]